MIHLSLALLIFIDVKHLLLGILIFIITFVVSLAIVTFILVKLPSTYFQLSHAREFLPGHSAWVRWTGLIGKNVVGVLLVLLGILMSIPGVPGQGVLTILLGIMLIDFPGKRDLECKILGRPKVLATVNRLRHKYGKKPLVLD